MCGIVGYIGDRSNPVEIVMEGLKQLEYRGYDSAGVAFVRDGKFETYKEVGKISNLEEKIKGIDISNIRSICVGHTRWATHGGVTVHNAHPHISNDGKTILVHNGIIENYAILKEMLTKKGYKFYSQTDTEVIVNLIEEHIKEGNSFEDAVILAVTELNGTFGLVISHIGETDKLIAVRKGSPIVIGVGDDESIIASDINAIVKHTKNVIYLDDGEIAIVKKDEVITKNFTGKDIKKDIFVIDWEIEQLNKGGYPHYMLKEIFEQPTAIENCIRGRLLEDEGSVKLGGIAKLEPFIHKIRKFVFIGCGTAYYAGLVGKYLMENIGDTLSEVDYASEFRYRNPMVGPRDVVVAITQSGETMDTLEALREAKRKGSTTIGIVNVVGSSIAREAGMGIYIHAGPEIGVASTKAFTNMIVALTMLSIMVGRKKRLGLFEGKEIVSAMKKLPELVDYTLNTTENVVKDLAKEFYKSRNFLYLGRHYNYPIALEGALKLKEISYIHAEGYPSAEMKHGPIALIDENMPVVFIATKGSLYDKIISNIQEVKARNGVVISIVNENDKEVSKISDYVITVPSIIEPLSPIINVIPLQLFAYHIAAIKGLDVDKPRNLAKSVTVE
ncbi:MAG: glutamine--fructose-6-phosphate transaminase (isomerizing) [Spirochaetia bacterium]|nr:glutamine--fructose-6-phosphate transaminase (isomerizing) [Spirochaetota bacterium]MCX8095998.1 glutamine--fructose-6-phosphate transaminase (isomerizing) [Spirochaetota bacterium]MDW8112515.1 glutamine--fructose-6-phosphate transaminase (isomerizing) [Spirochaetia bacterium]